MYPQLLTEQTETTMVEVIKEELKQSCRLDIASAFYSRGVLNMLQDPFREFLEENHTACIRFLTSCMNHFNDPDDLSHLKEKLPGIDVKIFYPSWDDDSDRAAKMPPPFHVKCMIFYKQDGTCSMIIGSSNLTAAGLERNYEWNYFSNQEVCMNFEGSSSAVEHASSLYEQYWTDEAIDLDERFIESYRRIWAAKRKADRSFRAELSVSKERKPAPKPNQIQEELLESLQEKRDHGIFRTSVIAATGLGKTLLAAFDFKQSGYRNILFIAHRELILQHALEAFRSVLDDENFGYLWSGTSGFSTSDDIHSCFAMVQTLSRGSNIKRYDPSFFDYVVIDEFHHAEADSYQKVLDHFTPKFFLGLTATPERMDGRDVLRICSYDVAGEVRLFDAIRRKRLVPFQYYAIYDETDYSQLSWSFRGYSEEELEDILIDDTRADLIINNFNRYLPSGSKIKALAFCCSVNHAKYMNRKFNEGGIPSAVLTGASTEEERRSAVQDLENEHHPLQCIFSVDIFGEGVDIPSITHVLMLRPTNSFTVFIQQLGRGLRKSEGKEFLVVMDFVGNFRNSFVAPLALRGYTSVPPDDRQMDVILKEDPPPGCYVHAETEVRRIWDDEIQRILSRADKKDRLKDQYFEIRNTLEEKSPGMLDFFAHPADLDPKVFVKQFGSWLDTKRYMEDLDPDETRLFDTPAYTLLRHIESGLSPSRSYKMVVLKVLLSLSGTSWSISEIAEKYLEYYLENTEHSADWPELEKYEDKKLFPLKKAEANLKKNPLDKLSNTKKKLFELNLASQMFSLKEPYRQYWEDEFVRAQISDRVEYVLAHYFYEKQKRREERSGYSRKDDLYRHLVTKSTFRDGFAVSRDAEAWFDAPRKAGESRTITMEFDNSSCPVSLRRLNSASRVVQVRYTAESKPLKQWIAENFNPNAADQWVTVKKVSSDRYQIKILDE